MVGSYRKGDERGGGILTVVGEDWKLISETCTDFWVGCVIQYNDCRVLIINVYIPPTTSPYAPPNFPTVLDCMSDWLTQTRLEVGNISQVIVCGDFNARAGTLISGQAWDTTEDSRGR